MSSDTISSSHNGDSRFQLVAKRHIAVANGDFGDCVGNHCIQRGES